MQTKTQQGISPVPQIVQQESGPLLPVPRQSESGALMQMIALAVERDDFDPDKLQKLLDVKERWDREEARKAYVSDMAAFKAEQIEIIKDKAVGYTNKDGTFTGYTHATIGNVVGVVCAALGRHGFSHRWDTKQDAGLITVTCVITHRMGHSESTALSGRPDDSGKKNAIQQTASTISYLQRYTLLAATGLATRDQEDDDARSSGEPEPTPEELEAQQRAAALLGEWIGAVNDCDTLETLKARKEEFAKAYGSTRDVPDALKAAYNAKLHALTPKVKP